MATVGSKVRSVGLWAVVIVLGASTSARAEERPSPTPFYVSGGVLAGLGVANLATAPLCTTSGIRHHTSCLALSVGFGAGFALASVPLFVIGAKRAHLEVAPTAGGARLSWSTSW